jgi:8-oxo-dGTP pyrophosphatase MutT (NUDIX family)
VTLAFDLPRNTIMPVSNVDVRLDPAPHPFELANAAAIETNWQHEIEANPALFDGRLVLLSALNLDGERLFGRCHEVRFASFLYWRKNRATDSAEHSFAHAALVSSDNALVAIRMGPHTASPGAVYFAACSFEPEDFVDGVCDPDGNMIREVGEETGLDISPLRRDAQMQLLSLENATAIFRRYWLDNPADAVAERIRAFVAQEAEPEIEGPVIIRKGEPLPEGTKPHMAAFAAWHFGKS